jgi:predicted Zn-dependent protease
MMMNLDIPLFKKTAGPFNFKASTSRFFDQAEWVGFRFYSEVVHERTARNGKMDTNEVSFDQGIMVEVLVDGHFGYCGTPDLSDVGLNLAFQKALELAQTGARHKVFKFTPAQRPKAVGHYRSPSFKGIDSLSLAEFTQTLALASQKLKASDVIVNALAASRMVETKIEFISSNGSHTEQEFLLIAYNIAATAQKASESLTRTFHGGVANCTQFGLEVLERDELLSRCETVAKEAIELINAPNCPTETTDLILAPDQMLLQIHESIGHPLELDRILGDERNFAGWSFVKPEDFGKLQYGSNLMNVTFDPTVPGEFASYAFDDCGNPAQKKFLIRNGILERGLGSLESQARSGLPGVANFRASSWNRAPIDRMANINIEPGHTSLKDMISQTERGIMMEANNSWSIDDYRNKFQFGCEFARLIENGKLTKVVKNPSYRGQTVPFWNSLKAVGSAEETEIYGSPWCGKGEPSQIIRVGHSSPPCLFSQVEVFGGLK